MMNMQYCKDVCSLKNFQNSQILAKNYTAKIEQEFTLHTCTLHKEAALAGQAPMNDLPSSGYHMRQNQMFEILLGLFLQLKV